MKTILFVLIFNIGLICNIAYGSPLLDIQEISLKNGSKAWLSEDQNLPIIAVNIAFKNAGSAQDPQNKQGLTRLLSNTMDEGAGPYNASQFQEQLNQNSITLYFQSDRDHFYGNLKMLSEDKDQAFKLLKLALSKPHFDQDAVLRMQQANQARIQNNRADPSWMAARLLNAKAYENHPYAQNSGGTLSSLQKITPQDLHNYHQKALAQDNIEITISGAITAKEAQKYLNDIISSLQKKSKLKKIQDAKLENTGKIIAYDADIPQTTILMAQPAPSIQSSEHEASVIANFVLGSSGFGSRLTKSIREDQGLTYGIYTYFDNKDHSNTLRLSTSTRNDQVATMLDAIEKQWNKIKSSPPTAEEINTAKTYLKGALPLGLSSTEAISGYLLAQKLNERSIDQVNNYNQRIDAITPRQVTDFINKWLKFENNIIIITGDSKAVPADQEIETLPDVE